MNILIFNYGCGIGGAEKLIQELSEQFEIKGHTVAFCFLDKKNNNFTGKKAYFINEGNLYSEILQLCGVIKDFNPDIIHTHNLTTFLRGSISGFIKNIPVIHTQHSHQKISMRANFLTNVLLPFASKFVFVSDDLMKNNRFLNIGNHLRIHNGIKTDFISKKQENQLFTIGVISRLEKVKDVKTAINAFNIVCAKNKNTQLIIIGDGDERCDLEDYANSLNSKKQIMFTGTKKNARKYLASLDLFISSSLSEGLSISIIEAMFSRTPVIATAVGGTPELIKDNYSGFLIPARNPEILAEKINFVIKNSKSKLIRDIINNAHNSVISHFNITMVAEAYIRLYNEALKH